MLQALGIIAAWISVLASAEGDSRGAQRQHTPKHHDPERHHQRHPSESKGNEAALPWCDEINLPGGSGDEPWDDLENRDDADGPIEPRRWKRHGKKGPKKHGKKDGNRGPERDEDAVAFGPGGVPCRHRNETGFEPGEGEHRHHEADGAHNGHGKPHDRALVAVLIVFAVLVVFGLFAVCAVVWKKKKKAQNSIGVMSTADDGSAQTVESKSHPLEQVVTADKISTLQSEPVPPKYAVARHSNGTPEPAPEYSQAIHISDTAPEYAVARSGDRSATNPVYNRAASGDTTATQA